MKVRAGATYKYEPCGLDILHPTNKLKPLERGQRVRVVKLRGCPPPNTMGQCYIANMEGEFIGMVSTGSLTR